MSSILILTIIVLVLVSFCLVYIFLHSRSGKKHAGLLANRFNKKADENNLVLSVTDKLVNGMLGIDYSARQLIVLQDQDDRIIDINEMQHCRKQKKWLHIPASRDNPRPETHLEKIVLACEFKQPDLPVELVFYEYRYNSIFQMQEREQQANYWEILINQQIKTHDAIQA